MVCMIHLVSHKKYMGCVDVKLEEGEENPEAKVIEIIKYHWVSYTGAWSDFLSFLESQGHDIVNFHHDFPNFPVQCYLHYLDQCYVRTKMC